jgi:hypothetical protein
MLDSKKMLKERYKMQRKVKNDNKHFYSFPGWLEAISCE